MECQYIYNSKLVCYKPPYTTSVDKFKDPKYFGTEIVLRSFNKVNLLIADAHVLAYAKRDCRDFISTPLCLYPASYVQYVHIRHCRRRHASVRVKRVIVGLDKFRKTIYISVVIFISNIVIQSTVDRPMSMFKARTLHVGIFAHLKMNALLV